MIEWIRVSGATAAALVLAAIMVVAAVAKLRSPSGTRADFESMGLIGAGPLSVAVPVVEFLVAVLLIVAPGWGGVLAAAILVTFTVVIVRILMDPTRLSPSCACFGGFARSPLSSRHLVRNALLLVLALVAASFDGGLNPLLAVVLH